MGNASQCATQNCVGQNQRKCEQICNKCGDSQEGQRRRHRKIQPIQFSELSQQPPVSDERILAFNARGQQNKELEQQRTIVENDQVRTGVNASNAAKIGSNQSENKQPYLIVRGINEVAVGVRDQSSTNAASLNLNDFSIPFKVIKLSLHPEIAEALQAQHPQFFSNHESSGSVHATKWRLKSNGSYINLINQLEGVFIATRQFYEGFYQIDEEDQIKADGYGLLITLSFIYKGYFSQGQAHGIGKLKMKKNGEIYNGLWQEGNFKSGKLIDNDIEFEGQFNGGLANGFGKLTIVSQKVKYEGKFRQGLFEDKEARYECKLHEYIGQFKRGKKNGRGKLYDKKKQKHLDGFWQNDVIVSIISYQGQESRQASRIAA